MKPLVYVIIPNRNGQEHLSYSLPSLASTIYPAYRAVLVDNRSTDGSDSFVRENFPWIEIVGMELDKGFAGGVNAGIRLALLRGAKYVAIYSNDIKVVSGWLEIAVGILERRRDVGVVGYVELPRESEDQLRMPAVLEWREDGRPGPLYVCRAEMFKAVGLYDERFFMYGEELDLFARLERYGYKVIQANVPVWHYGGGFRSQAPFKVAWLRHRNGIRYAIKNESPKRVIYRAGALLYYAIIPARLPLGQTRIAGLLGRTREGQMSEQALEWHRWTQQQIRPSRWAVINTCVWAAAVLWNVVFLLETLMARRRDRELLRRVRRDS